MLKATVNDFEEIFNIMQDSFPSDEYRFKEEQKALFDIENYAVYIEKVDDKIVSFLAIWEFSGFIFLEHFAVEKTYRSKGLGSKMLTELANIYQKTICLEVELPINEQAIKRIEFYKKNGYFYNEYEYYQPPISKGKNPVPLRIVSHEKPLDKLEFNAVKDALYKLVYKTDFRY
jgi:ribosomal protein S18 acetylase RimI-like enzyme